MNWSAFCILPGSNLINGVCRQLTTLTSSVRVTIEIACKVRGKLINLAFCKQGSTSVIKVNIVCGGKNSKHSKKYKKY